MPFFLFENQINQEIDIKNKAKSIIKYIKKYIKKKK